MGKCEHNAMGLYCVKTLDDSVGSLFVSKGILFPHGVDYKVKRLDGLTRD